MTKAIFSKVLMVAASASMLAACGNVSYTQKESPANAYKDYRQDDSAAIVGVGDPISKRQMRANAVLRAEGNYSLEQIMQKVANTYNIAVRWGAGVREEIRNDILVSDLTFDESRSYIEDVFKVQIVREGERRLLVLPSAEEARISEFAPGVNVSLSQALRGLARQCDMNLVITENKQILAETLVTTSLRDVTCFDAMGALLTPHGLSLVDAGDYYTIGGFPQRQWSMNLFEEVRQEDQEISYASEFSSAGSEGGTTTSGGTVKVSMKNERDLWKELETDLNALVEKSCEESDNQTNLDASQILPPPTLIGETGTTSTSSSSSSSSGNGSFVCGYVRINKTVGLVQMRAPHSILQQADEIVKRVQDIASRRLLVEARVMAVTKSRGFEQGGDITTSAYNDGFNQGTIGHKPSINSISTALTGRLRALDSTAGGLLAWKSNDIDAAVRITEEYGTTYQLMQPSLEVMDRQRAILIDGRNERYFIREAETETTDVGVIRNVTAQERVQFVGIQFSVSAQIADGNEPHTVNLQVPMTEITRFDKLTQVFDGQTFTDNIPIATSRVIDQKVRIRDGEIKVIGGLNRTIAIDRESGVPLIRGIPLAGKLFNDEDISYEDVEFIVLLQVRRIF